MYEEKLIEKSKEAFVMAIEIYNKPSIKNLRQIQICRLLYWKKQQDIHFINCRGFLMTAIVLQLISKVILKVFPQMYK